MPIEQHPDATVITGENSIRYFRLLALRGALKLECLGLKRRGQSAASIIKQEFGLKGSKKVLLAQFEAYISAEYPHARSAQ